jgi:hypothetical protein
MIKRYNTVCVDNFLSEPNLFRKFGLSLSKVKDDNGQWPGYRSQPLFEIDKDLHNLICLKVLSCYYDLRHVDIFWDEATLMFQSISSFSNKKDSLLNQGWIHKDHNQQLAAILYLTPDADLDSGTSLFDIKPGQKNKFLDYGVQSEKQAFYKDEKVIEKNYIKAINNNNNKFIEKTRFQNVYNRLIAYDANEYHRANNFYTGKKSKDRLTLAIFINGIKSNKTLAPLERINDKENFDDLIKYRIEYLK